MKNILLAVVSLLVFLPVNALVSGGYAPPAPEPRPQIATRFHLGQAVQVSRLTFLTDEEVVMEDMILSENNGVSEEDEGPIPAVITRIINPHYYEVSTVVTYSTGEREIRTDNLWEEFISTRQ